MLRLFLLGQRVTKVVWDAAAQPFEMQTEPGSANPDDPTDASVEDLCHQQTVHQGDGFNRNTMPDRLQRELVATDAADGALLPCGGIAVFDGADGATLRPYQSVHVSLNPRHA